MQCNMRGASAGDALKPHNYMCFLFIQEKTGIIHLKNLY